MSQTFSLTDSGHNSAHEVESSFEIPASPGSVHTDTSPGGLLVGPEEALEVPVADVVLAAEEVEAARPAAPGLLLLRPLQRREHSGAAHQVHQDEERQHGEARRVLARRAQTQTAARPSACHHVPIENRTRLRILHCPRVRAQTPQTSCSHIAFRRVLISLQNTKHTHQSSHPDTHRKVPRPL